MEEKNNTIKTEDNKDPNLLNEELNSLEMELRKLSLELLRVKNSKLKTRQRFTESELLEESKSLSSAIKLRREIRLGLISDLKEIRKIEQEIREKKSRKLDIQIELSVIKKMEIDKEKQKRRELARASRSINCLSNDSISIINTFLDPVSALKFSRVSKRMRGLYEINHNNMKNIQKVGVNWFLKEGKEIVEDIQLEISRDLEDYSSSFFFGKKLKSLINKYSKTEVGKRLIDEAFNTLDKKEKEEITTISTWFLRDPKLNYFPRLQGFENVRELSCKNENLTVLDLRLKNLKKLNCEGNKLQKLYVRELEELEVLNCKKNNLTELDVRGLIYLQELECCENKIKKLKIKGLEYQEASLSYIYCGDNPNLELDIDESRFTRSLHCHNTPIEKIRRVREIEKKLERVKKREKVLSKEDKTEIDKIIQKKRKKGIQKLQKEIRKSMGGFYFETRDYRKGSESFFSENILSFNKNLRHLINGHAETKEGREVTNEAFNTLDKNFKLKIRAIKNSRLYENTLKPYIKFFPVLKGFDNLTELSCSCSELEELDVRGLKALEKLDCGQNKIEILHIEGLKNLKVLHCSENKIKKLNLAGMTKLWKLQCSRNELKELDVRGRKSLQKLECCENKIKKLKIKGLEHKKVSLSHISCGDNPHLELDIDESRFIGTLWCSNTRLGKIRRRRRREEEKIERKREGLRKKEDELKKQKRKLAEKRRELDRKLEGIREKEEGERIKWSERERKMRAEMRKRRESICSLM